MDSACERIPELQEAQAQNSHPYPAPMTYRALEAPKASSFEDLSSDLSLLPLWAAMYSFRLADIVGRITVQYPACLYSIAMVPTAIPRSLPLIQYYFGL